MTDDLKQRLRELSASRKPYPTGAHGQMVGMESYRIVANGFALECVDEAADRIEQLESERDELMACLNLIYSWANNWDSEFMNDPDWINTDYPRIQAAIAKLKGQS